MKATLITEKNQDLFFESLSASVLDENDLFIGAFDEETDTACGVLAAATDKTTYLNFMYVDPAYRKMGAGSAMLDMLTDILVSLDVCEIACVCTRERKKGKAKADSVLDFLSHHGFEESGAEVFTTYEMKLSDITAPSVKGKDVTLIPLREASEHQWRAYRSKVDAMMKDDKEGYILPLENKEFYDPECSFIALSKNARVAGAILVDIDKTSTPIKVHLDELRTFKDKTGEIALSLISSGVGALKDGYPGKTVIAACPTTKVHKSVMDRLTEGKVTAVSDAVVYVSNLKTSQH